MFPDAFRVVQVSKFEAVVHCSFAGYRHVKHPRLRPDAGHGCRSCLGDLRKHPFPIVGGGVALLVGRPVRINLAEEVFAVDRRVAQPDQLASASSGAALARAGTARPAAIAARLMLRRADRRDVVGVLVALGMDNSRAYG